MKTITTLGLILLFGGTGFIGQAQSVTSQSSRIKIVPAPTPYLAVGKDANSTVWQRTVYEQDPSGNVISVTHGYTEIATGLHYQKNGQWLDSQEQISILPNGTAVAINGQHQAYFPGDIYNGQIKLVTPDGKQLYSQPLCLTFFDGTNSVVIAELTNSLGLVAGNNQVIYPNAFTGFSADLRYTYTKAGFEQDVILHEQPPTPESLGLNAATARLEMLTEFFNPPPPAIQSSVLPAQAGLTLTDQCLNFGTMQMIQGRAFLTGQNAQDAGALVNKQWLQLEGRQILVEEVPVDAIVQALAALPLTAVGNNLGKSSHIVSRHLVLPPQRLAKNNSASIRLAKMDRPTQGFVLDYQTLNSSQTNYTFQSDTTYYISGSCYLYGTNIFEGGAVLKYAANASINITYPASVQMQTTAYRPVIFTAKDDNTVGDGINGSTGSPTPGAYANPALYLANQVFRAPLQTFSNIRISYANQALTFYSFAPASFYNIQMVDCQNGVNDYGTTVNFYNVLFAQVGYCFNNYNYATINVANGTFDYEQYVATSGSTGNLGMTIKNSIFADGRYFISGNPLYYSVSGNNNGFYNNAFAAFTAGVSSSQYPFQAVGAGSYYLANGSPFRNAGTTNIDPTLLAGLKQRTTCPPLVYSNVTMAVNTTLPPQAQRDAESPGPDLGYHYDPIDYITENYAITNATLTITSGTVIACANTNGIELLDGSAISSIGTPAAPNWFTHYAFVQEQSVWLGPDTDQFAALNVVPVNGGGTRPTGVFQFSKFSRPPGSGWHFYDDTSSDNGYSPYSYQNLLIQDCELWNGNNIFSGAASATAVIKNTLFARSRFYALENASIGYSLSLSNNLFWKITGSPIDLQIYLYASNSWSFFNNVFDTCRIDVGNAMSNGANAYFNCSDAARIFPTNGLDIVQTNGLAYQAGPLGNFYQPTNSPLIDKGNTTAVAAGLAAFYTTLTNQTPDSGTVDIGYHYAIPQTNSLGTDFWLALFNMDDPSAREVDNELSLFITSPVPATGTVTIPGLIGDGQILIISNLDDPTVNGTYVRTNFSQAEQLGFNSFEFENIGLIYVKGTNVVISPSWQNVQLLGYDSGGVSFLYVKDDDILNGSDWYSASDSSPVTMTSSCAQAPFSQNFSVTPGGWLNIALPLAAMLANYDQIATNGIHVVANEPVSVYAMDCLQNVSAAFTGYPTPMLGTNYCVMGWPGDPSQLAIVATAANTTVTITPSATADLAGFLWTNSFILQPGETYQINSSNDTDDVTGTLITSDKPIGVFAGAAGAEVPTNYSSANPLVQEQLPVDSWGTNVVALSFAGRVNGDSYRVLAANSNTVVTISGIVVTVSNGIVTTNYATVTVTNQAGVPYDIILDGPVEFQATKPIQVAQFANGQELSGVPGDPCEILLPPTGHYLAANTVFAPINDIGLDEHYLNLIVAHSGITNVSVDGSTIAAANFVAIGTSGYYGAQWPVTNGVHTVTGSLPVGVEVYGFGLNDAYGYFGGLVK
jgi:hypothetical protein